MAGAGGQDGDIARLQREYATLGAAEADAPFSARDAKYFMDSGVVVYVIVDAITPGVPPSVRFEKVFDDGRRIVASFDIDGAAIEDQRPPRMVGDETVVLEPDGVRFSGADKIRSRALARDVEFR